MVIHTITLFSFTFCNKSLTFAIRKNHEIKNYYGFQFHRDNLVSSSSSRSHCIGIEDQGGIFVVVHRHCAWCHIIQRVDGHRL